MSTTITISEQVAQHLDNLSVNNADDTNSKLKGLLEAEYRRRLTRFMLADQQLSNNIKWILVHSSAIRLPGSIIIPGKWNPTR